MVPRRRVVEQVGSEAREHTAPAVVLPFPAREKAEPASEPQGARLPAAPSHGERPTRAAHTLREWLRVTLVVSLAVHAVIFVAFQLRFEDDLERAAGAAAARANDGSTNVLVEIVTTAALPSAPSPTDSTDAEAERAVPTLPEAAARPSAEQTTKKAEIEKLIPLPEPAILPPLEASVEPAKQPAREQAVQTALPVEETAAPQPVATAEVSKAPEITAVVEPVRPAPPVREAAKPVERREEKQAKRPAPSAAASPSRAAGGDSSGRAGGGGIADAGGRAATSSYLAQVQAHLARFNRYPAEARDKGAIGSVRVQFVLARDGRLVSASLMGTSGERALDQAALEQVRRASPFPPIPSAIAQTTMNIAAPIRFDLR
jgi:protein TonB